MPFENTATGLSQVAREAVATGLELADRPEDRRVWLEFGVGVEKENEAFTAERAKRGITRPDQVLTAHRHRLDAEIALMKHAQQREAK